ncbi:GTP cyclohydrolase I FolE [Robiginitomaculum antarcticum]|uniref:GTP cyclohydrolase I FolE n=1 Tax=Robiginitomaculum antarcticum TaxID=437507 RepID=UPI0003754F46|nr:GTP cyclohydrolase I FolE [Robiginitomaculum antarcticum]
MSQDPAAKPLLKAVNDAARPSHAQAMEAVQTLLSFIGEDPSRVGLRDTPRRVIDAYAEWFAGYDADPAKILSKTFEDINGYDDMVILRKIDVESHCEHHMAPFLGTASVAYLPAENVVGISKLARVVEIYAKRLQNQENLTTQIINAIESGLKPRGTAVMIEAVHQCMSTRGVHHANVSTITTRFTGEFKTNPALQERFLNLVKD